MGIINLINKLMDQSSNNSSTQASGQQISRRKVENSKRLISDYNLVRIIGTGTFGKVYLCMNQGKSYAIKMLHKRKIIELK